MAKSTLAKSESDPNSSGYKCAQWMSQAKSWELMSDLWESPMYVRGKGEKYLRKNPQESPKKYEQRLDNSVPQGKLRECIETMAGMVFKDNPAPEQAPTALADLFKDIDARGNSLHSFLQQSFAKFLRDGGGAIHVNATKLSDSAREKVANGEKLTAADRQGDRPFWTWVEAKEMIGYREDNSSGVVKPLQIVIQRNEIIPEGKYGEAEILRNYIFRSDGSFAVEYWDSKTGAWLADPDMPEGNTGQDEITIALASEYGSAPPLETLAMNDLLFYNKESDFDDWCHNACVPERIYNFDSDSDAQKWKDQLKNSASTARAMWGQYAKAYFNEVSGSGMEVVERRIAGIAERIAQLGVGMLAPTEASPKTASEVIDTAGQRQSKLAWYAREFENCVEKAFYFTMLYLKSIGGAAVEVTDETTLKLKMDFDRLTFTPEKIQVFKDLLANGDMSRLTFWEMIAKSEEMPEKWTPEVEIERLDKEEQKAQEQFGKNTLNALKAAKDMPGLPPATTGNPTGNDMPPKVTTNAN